MLRKLKSDDKSFKAFCYRLIDVSSSAFFALFQKMKQPLSQRCHCASKRAIGETPFWLTMTDLNTDMRQAGTTDAWFIGAAEENQKIQNAKPESTPWQQRKATL